MANGFYKEFFDQMGQGNIDLLTDTLKAVLVDADDYTVNLSTHEDLADVPAGARVATATLSGRSLTSGVFDASDTLFTTVSGDEFEALILYKDTGVEGTSSLICYIDDFIATTPSGTDILIVWDSGANKIFSLN